MQDKLRQIIQRYEELEGLVNDSSTIANRTHHAKLMKERGELSKVVQRIKSLEEIRKQMEETTLLSKSEGQDKDFHQMIEDEIKELAAKEERLKSELEEMLLPGTEENSRNVIIEIRAGTGGDEASLFAADLFRMYLKYIEKRAWKASIMESSQTGLGGLKQVTFSVEGENVYRDLRFESGTHRVQRVPKTEASGRIHTSAVTVAVLPEAEDIEVEIKSDDLKLDSFCASGPGGQYVNKTASAIRLTHIPTGVVVECQSERSQHRNKELALKLLRARIYEKQISDSKEKRDTMRRNQIGTGDRSEKIRTYNFPQNRLTDHRINFSSHNLEEILNGRMEELIAELARQDKEKRLKQLATT
jgi:peptide chain release factor 1